MGAPIYYSLGKFFVPAIGAAIGLALAGVFFVYVKSDLASDARLRFDRQTNDAKHIIETRLLSHVTYTFGLRALFSSRRPVSRAEFHHFVSALDLKRNYPGFEVLNFARFIRSEERKKFEDEVRNDRSLNPGGYPKFSIRPEGNRPEYEVLIYLEPYEGNEFAFGLDIGVANAQTQARARDTGDLVTSGRLLSIGQNRFVGLSMRVPLYQSGMPINTVEQRRQAFIGTVGAGYNVRNLMAGVLDETTMKSMRYRLYDTGLVKEIPAKTLPKMLLYDSAQGTDGIPKDDASFLDTPEYFNSVLNVQFGGRNWELHFNAPKSNFSNGTDDRLPWLVLTGGVMLSLLLFLALYGFSSSSERALMLANEITRELRESEAELAHAQAQARLGSWTLDLDCGQMTWSAETFRLLHVEPKSVTSCFEKFLERLDDADRADFTREAERCVASGESRSCEFQLHYAGSAPRWMHYVLQPLMVGEGTPLRGTIMDITERQRALESQRANSAQIRDLLRRLVTVQEAERRGLSANLHDMVGQSLSVLGMGLQTIRGMLPIGAVKHTEQTFNEMNRLLKETMASVRAVMSDLRPPLLDDYGLYAAMEWHARQFGSRTGLKVSVDGGELEPRLASEVELALFRIAQEALINVAKHAEASSARISISAVGGRTRLSVEDNGRGSAPAVPANDPNMGGWGMAVMRERAAAVGGALRIEHLDRGTRIIVEVASDSHRAD
ncbi:MAG: CHASE domain-containing protein [Burkholderiales bacterium]